MQKSGLERFHDFVLHTPAFLEKIVAAILIIGVGYGCVKLAIDVFSFGAESYTDYIETLMTTAFNIVIAIEFIRMLVKHSMNTIIEVLIFAIARGLVVGHVEPFIVLISIAAISLLLICRKFLFHSFDFEEEK